MFRRSFLSFSLARGTRGAAHSTPAIAHKVTASLIHTNNALVASANKKPFRSNIPRAVLSARLSSKPEGEPVAKAESAAPAAADSAKGAVEGEAVGKDTGIRKFDPDSEDDYYEPETPREKVAYYSVLFARLSLLLGIAALAFFTFRELFPGRMNPFSLFSEVFEVVRINDEIMQICGNDMKAFGRDVGRNTEGRRNHVDSRKYKEADGSNRTRIRFNVKGSKGQAQIWAEVSDKMASNEFVYVICQDQRTGRVVTIQDNRARLEAEIAAGSQEGKDAIASLLGSFGVKK